MHKSFFQYKHLFDISEPGIRELNINDMKDILWLEDTVPITDRYIKKLLKLGWKKDFIKKIEDKAPRCEHGKIVAFYSPKRESILFQDEVKGQKVIVIIKKNDMEIDTYLLPIEMQG